MREKLKIAGKLLAVFAFLAAGYAGILQLMLHTLV